MGGSATKTTAHLEHMHYHYGDDRPTDLQQMNYYYYYYHDETADLQDVATLDHEAQRPRLELALGRGVHHERGARPDQPTSSDR
jgi:hypothetical protein